MSIRWLNSQESFPKRYPEFTQGALLALEKDKSESALRPVRSLLSIALCGHVSSREHQPRSDVLVGISGGEVTSYKSIRGPSNIDVVNINDIIFDSTELVQIAKKQFDLRPGEDWATGYHYVLSVNSEGSTVVTVVGVDPTHYFTKINFDPKSGDVTEAMHKVAKGGGLLKYNNLSKDRVMSMEGQAIKGINSIGEKVVIWGDKNPREFNTLVNPYGAK